MTDDAEPARLIYSAVAVANWFISRNQEVSGDMTHLKLQKMLFLAQGWHLAYFDFPLFEDPIEAWKYGPVVAAVYFALSSRPKSESITVPIEGYVVRGNAYSPLGTPEMIPLDDDTEDFMRSVWDRYSNESAWKLVGITHAKGSPWEIVANSLGNIGEGDDTSWEGIGFNSVIPVELIKSYFKSYLPKNQ
ncbi:MAG: DUF4065 domain-containing protein [Deltaproteobacteria bacterium]|nr:DUF4065 domain-containing protein [Deltaproteobacteria bacterium]